MSKKKISHIIDMQAHILPETDSDRFETDEVLEMLLMAYEKGIRKIIATPKFRFLPDLASYQREYRRLADLCEELEREAEQRGIRIRIYLGQEIEYFEDLTDYLKKGLALSMAESPYVLVKFSHQVSFKKLLDMIQKLKKQGYIPVIAHVDHFMCLREEGKLEDLIDAGACMHICYESFCGKLLDHRVRWCKKQILEGNIHFLGTDLNWRDPDRLKIEPFLSWCRKKAPDELWKLLHENPMRIINGKLLTDQTADLTADPIRDKDTEAEGQKVRERRSRKSQ